MSTPLSGVAKEHERLEEWAKGLAALRLLLASLAIAVTLILRVATAGTDAAAELFGIHPVYTVAVAACVADVIYLLFLRIAREQHKHLVWLASGGLIADILMGSMLVYLTGGYSSAYLPLLFVWVIAAGTALSARAAFGAAALAAAGLAAAVLLRHFGFYPGPATPTGLWKPSASLLAQSGAFFIVAYLAGALSRHLAAAQLLADEVLAAVDQGLVVLDSRGQVSFANREAERLLGAEMPRGADPDEALTGGHLEMIRRLLKSRQRFGPEQVELPPRGDAGETLSLALSGTPVIGARGAFRGLIVVISDRSVERALQEAKQLAAERRQAADMAMGIAHEIRNPLGAIRGAIQEIGREREISPLGRELTDVVLAESDRLDRIITDFLTFARPRPPEPRPVRPRLLVAEVEELLNHSLPSNGKIETVNEIAESALCLADADQLRQALLNLALNAAASMTGGGQVRFSSRPARREEFLAALPRAQRARVARADKTPLHGECGLVLEVRDSGAGMAADVLERAAEPFFTTRADGTGLGLAIVERIALAHDGALSITSEAGKGTSAAFWLPAPAPAEDNGHG